MSEQKHLNPMFLQAIIGSFGVPKENVLAQLLEIVAKTGDPETSNYNFEEFHEQTMIENHPALKRGWKVKYLPKNQEYKLEEF